MPVFTVPQVAEQLSVSTARIYELIGAGVLGAIDVSAGEGRRPRWRIDDDSLRAFLSERRSGGTALDPPGGLGSS